MVNKRLTLPRQRKTLVRRLNRVLAKGVADREDAPLMAEAG
jgi:hypothetical protein